jgi:bifunctional non-homologous end joining protein LigD
MPVGKNSKRRPKKRNGATVENPKSKIQNRLGGDVAGVALTHPDRVIYPEQGITKRELAQYYASIADWVMPQLENRLLTLVRCPQGAGEQCFYQRHAKENLGDTIHSIPAAKSKSAEGYIYLDSLAGLITLVQIGVLEIHTWGSRVENLERPDRLIFDLDPDASIGWAELREAAETVRAQLTEIGLTPFVKTTGGKGLHVIAPIVPKADWDCATELCRAITEKIVRSNPERYVATMSKSRRVGKIFIDYLRNARTATAVAAYSTRARPGAPVSTPVTWKELSRDVRSEFNVRNVPERLSRMRQDPWKNFESAPIAVSRAMLGKL